MKKRLLFIFNPKAGMGKIKDKLFELIILLSGSEYETIMYATKQKMDAHNVVKEYALESHLDRILCAGGDGTLDEVVSGVMEAGVMVPIAYIPCGTMNDFGYTLGIPKGILPAARFGVHEQPMFCDVGKVNEIYFTYSVSFGLFTDVSYGTPQSFKNIFGRLAYILTGISKLPQVRPYQICVEYEGGVIEESVLLGMVSNSNSIGGFKGLLGNDAVLDDGLYEMILIKQPKKLTDLTSIINDLLQHRYNEEFICYAKISKAKFYSKVPIQWAVDGEFGGEFQTAEVEILKKAVAYIRNENTALLEMTDDNKIQFKRE